MLDVDHAASQPSAATRPVGARPARPALDEIAATRAALNRKRPRSLLSAAEWQEWLTAAEVDVEATPPATLERLYDLEYDLHWRDACSQAQIEGHSAFLDEEPQEANPYAGQPEDKEWDAAGHSYRSLQQSCAFLWDMGWREGRFTTQIDRAHDLLAAGDAVAAEQLIKAALEKYDER